MLPWQPILGKIGERTFIWDVGILKRIGILQFLLENIRWQYFSYIECKVDEDQSSKPGEMMTVKTAIF